MDLRSIYQKLGLSINLENSQKMFIDRINNLLFYSKSFNNDYFQINNLYFQFCNEAMIKYVEYLDLKFVFEQTKDFQQYLINLQILLKILLDKNKNEYDILISLIKSTLDDIPYNLGYSLKKIKNDFYIIPLSCQILDKDIVEDVLNFIDSPEKLLIYKPYAKGLKEFLESKNNNEKSKNVIRDMYESLEALAKFICKNGKDLSSNCELFIKTIKVNDYYKKILKNYIDFSNEYRHPPKKPGNQLTEKEIESFIYFTGIFIRLSFT